MTSAPIRILLLFLILLQSAAGQDKEVAQLPPKEGIEDGDLIYTVSGGTDYKVNIGEELGARDTANRDRSNHTGEQPMSSVTGLEGALSGLESTAELDARDAANRSRTNHTGEQAISTITGLQAALDDLDHTPLQEQIDEISTYQDQPSDFGSGDVALITVAGQSNAFGVNGTAPAAPLANIWVMGEAGREWIAYNTSNNNAWIDQNTNTRNPLTAIALAWQTRINAGDPLPDLYIINVGINGEGVSPRNTTSPDRSRFHPYKLKSDLTTEWGDPEEGVYDANASGFELIRETIEAGVLDLQLQGKRVVHLATVWNQWETDALTEASADDYRLNIHLIRNLYDEALKINDSNFFFWYPRAEAQPQYAYLSRIKSAFEEFQSSRRRVFRIDAFTAPTYNGTSPNYGIYDDGIHYLASVQDWAASYVLDAVLTGGSGHIGQTAGQQIPEAEAVGVEEPDSIARAEEYRARTAGEPRVTEWGADTLTTAWALAPVAVSAGYDSRGGALYSITDDQTTGFSHRAVQMAGRIAQGEVVTLEMDVKKGSATSRSWFAINDKSQSSGGASYIDFRTDNGFAEVTADPLGVFNSVSMVELDTVWRLRVSVTRTAASLFEAIIVPLVKNSSGTITSSLIGSIEISGIRIVEDEAGSLAQDWVGVSGPFYAIPDKGTVVEEWGAPWLDQSTFNVATGVVTPRDWVFDAALFARASGYAFYYNNQSAAAVTVLIEGAWSGAWIDGAIDETPPASTTIAAGASGVIRVLRNADGPYILIQ